MHHTPVPIPQLLRRFPYDPRSVLGEVLALALVGVKEILDFRYSSFPIGRTRVWRRECPRFPEPRKLPASRLFQANILLK